MVSMIKLKCSWRDIEENMTEKQVQITFKETIVHGAEKLASIIFKF